MFKDYLSEFLTTPHRLANYAKRRPYAAIGYGTLLLLGALFARIVVTLAAGIAIGYGIYFLLTSKPD